MAVERGGPGGLVQFILGTLGFLCVAGSVLFRDENSSYSIALLGVGIALVALALLLPWISRMKLPGGTEIEFKEREASAKAADATVTVDEVSREIASSDRQPPTQSDEDTDVIGTLNYIAGNMSLQAVFDWSTAEGEPLAGCHLRLYLLDEEEDVLRAVLAQPDAASATTWRVGQGATGSAYASGDYILATGSEVSDGTYGLDAEQQARFRKLAAVAAAPVVNAGNRVIGVVTASTSDLDHELATEEARRDHTLAALLVGRILVELLQWFDDGP